MFSQLRRNIIIAIFISMFTYVLLSASGGESSINNDDNEVIGSIDINDEDPSSIEE